MENITNLSIDELWTAACSGDLQTLQIIIMQAVSLIDVMNVLEKNIHLSQVRAVMDIWQ